MLKLILFSLSICCVKASSENRLEKILFDSTATTLDIKSENSVGFKFLQHYQSNNPVVLLLDNTQTSYDDASNFYNEIANTTSINFLLMEFQEGQVSPVLETTKNNEKRFKEMLTTKLKYHSSSLLGSTKENKTAAFYGISNAAKQLKNNGAIIIFISRKVYDEALAQVTLKYVRDLNIKVYVIWGKKKAYTAEERILKEFAIKSGGNFYIANKKLSEQYYQDFLDNLDNYSTASTVLSKKSLQYQHNLNFPIDSDVTSIHINISPNLTTGILTTPSGKRINVLNEDEVANYAIGSFTKRDEYGGIHEIHLNTTAKATAATQDVGIWFFLVNNAGAFYNVQVFVHSKLTTDATITFINTTEFQGSKKKIVQLGVIGDITSIKNISLLTKDGEPIRDNVNFTLLSNDKKKFENIQNVRNEIKINVEQIPNEPFYAIVNGKDSQGHDFKRLSYVSQNIVNDIFNVPKLTIDVGIGSELITSTNRNPEIVFEVTNNHNQVSLVRFSVNDDKSMLLRMDPLYKWISPQETAIVRVTLVTRSGVNLDTVTFTASGAGVIQKKVLVEVGRGAINDNEAPALDYKFLSTCNEVMYCYNGAWSVEVKARDAVSGLLQLTSNPKGLYFNNDFITGTRHEVIAYYAQSCCNPDLLLTAVDRNGKTATKSLNAYRGPLGAGAIAAIVLGVLFLILLIILIIYIFLHPPNNQSGSFDLPTYRGPSGSKI